MVFALASWSGYEPSASNTRAHSEGSAWCRMALPAHLQRWSFDNFILLCLEECFGTSPGAHGQKFQWLGSIPFFLAFLQDCLVKQHNRPLFHYTRAARCLKLPLCTGSGEGSDHIVSLIWPLPGPCAKRELSALGCPCVVKQQSIVWMYLHILLIINLLIIPVQFVYPLYIIGFFRWANLCPITCASRFLCKSLYLKMFAYTTSIFNRL
jgi:hypothetical protein